LFKATTTRVEEITTSIEIEKKINYIGQTYSLESINYPQYRIGVRDDSTAAILLFGVEEFRIVKGKKHLYVIQFC
jgi:hypothetical protein